MRERKFCLIATADSEEIADGGIFGLLESVDGADVIFVWRKSGAGQSDGVEVLPDAVRERALEIVETGPVGVSRARNLGLEVAKRRGLLSGEYIIAFPDDDCMYTPDVLPAVATQMERLRVDLVALPYGPSSDAVDAHRFPDADRPLSKRFVLRSCASVGLFIVGDRLRHLRFDEQLGAGTPLAAGEELDLVLRLLEEGARGHYFPRPIVIHEYRPAPLNRLGGGVAAVKAATAMDSSLRTKLIRAVARSIYQALLRRDVSAGRAVLRGLRFQRENAQRSELFQSLDLPSVWTPTGLRLTSAPPQACIDAAVTRFSEQQRQPMALLAAHITALNAWRNPSLRLAFAAGSAVYADGISASLASRLFKGRSPKMATTDLAPLLIARLSEKLGRDVRVVVVGGESGVAGAAIAKLAAMLPITPAYHDHGFHDDWTLPLSKINASDPDVIILGLGMPKEAEWLVKYGEKLPVASIVITCGGWLRLLAGSENRSPRVVQRLQLEWAYRLCTNPRRTFKRYAMGLGTMSHLAIRAALRPVERITNEE